MGKKYTVLRGTGTLFNPIQHAGQIVEHLTRSAFNKRQRVKVLVGTYIPFNPEIHIGQDFEEIGKNTFYRRKKRRTAPSKEPGRRPTVNKKKRKKKVKRISTSSTKEIDSVKNPEKIRKSILPSRKPSETPTHLIMDGIAYERIQAEKEVEEVIENLLSNDVNEVAFFADQDVEGVTSDDGARLPLSFQTSGLGIFSNTQQDTPVKRFCRHHHYKKVDRQLDTLSIAPKGMTNYQG